MQYTLASLLDTLRHYLYQTPLKRLLVTLGIESDIRRGYWLLFTRLTSPQSIVVAGTTATFDIRSEAEYWRTQNLFDERPVIQDLLTELNPSDVFYDIGANIGIYSCFAVKRLQDGIVVGFEPHPETASHLRRNLQLNGRNFDVYQYALSDTEMKAQLGPLGSGGRLGTYSLNTTATGSGLEVFAVRGDDLRERESLPMPDVVKIDVEGTELAVLNGLRETLEDGHCRAVYVEVHATDDGQDDTGSATEAALREVGFRVTEIHRRGNERFLKATR